MSLSGKDGFCIKTVKWDERDKYSNTATGSDKEQ